MTVACGHLPSGTGPAGTPGEGHQGAENQKASARGGDPGSERPGDEGQRSGEVRKGRQGGGWSTRFIGSALLSNVSFCAAGKCFI